MPPLTVTVYGQSQPSRLIISVLNITMNKELPTPILEVLYPAKLVPDILANGGIQHEVDWYAQTYGKPLEHTILKDGRLYIREKLEERVKG